MSRRTYESDRAPAPVQVLSIIFYAGFGIAVSVVAMNIFWPAGMALAAFIAYQWGRIPNLSGHQNIDDTIETLRPDADQATHDSSGNSSFDAYRDELMARLEQEKKDFQAFLDRLRQANDKTQFDEYLNDRAEDTKPA